MTTKLLRRFGGLGWFSDKLSSFPCRHGGSPFLRTNRRLMETATHPVEPSPAPANPRWVLLSRCGDKNDDSIAIDDKTTVRSRSSTGRPFRVSLRLAAPPASSILYHDWADRSEGDEHYPFGAHVMAAHGADSILFQATDDHFVYTAGAGRPPSISLLPAFYIPMLYQRKQLETYQKKEHLPLTNDCAPGARTMTMESTGLLRCGAGDDELLVAQLEVTDDAPYDTAELCVLRPGHGWELKREVPIVRAAYEPRRRWCRKTSKYVFVAGDEALRCPETTAVIPVGDRFLCWANYAAGTMLVCDMMEENPKLLYVPMPVDPVIPKVINFSDDEEDEGDEPPPVENCRSIGAAGANEVRLISINPRCCCGGHGRSTCARSRSAFRVSAWILKLSTNGVMIWMKDGLLDSDELWTMPGYEGLPRVYPQCPVVSSDNPDVVCFIVCEEHLESPEGRKVWMIEVDTRRKVLLSVCRCNTGSHHVAVNLHC